MSITAPYNFVPLAEQIFFPDWGDHISHDIPFADGLSGVLSLTITAHTPLLIGAQQTKNSRGSTVVTPFQLPATANENVGRYAIPGTSLRGMIRNVLEIASFGKMQGVDDKRYAVRDLSADFYKKLLTRGNPYNGLYANSTGGWLRYQHGQWTITPCQYARVEQSALNRYTHHGRTLSTHLKTKQEAAEKYALWRATHGNTAIYFDTTASEVNQHQRHRLALCYRLADNLGTGATKGELVFTGQAGRKHMEFIFYNPAGAFRVPDDKIQDFLFTYGETNHWRYLKQHHANAIPVFFLRHGATLHSIGLSQMYKVAYKNTLHDAIRNTSADHLSTTKRDLAELIFGYTDDEQSDKGLKGRVSFSHAVCEQQQVQCETKTTILNSPKPTYYPNYIQQDEMHGELKDEQSAYKTLMDNHARLRGWKRYPVRAAADVKVPVPDAEQGDAVRSVITALQPDDAGLRFRAKVRFHNLKAVELGAILWAIQWGGDNTLRHAMGMGKSFGYGQLSMQINEQDSQLLANNGQDNEQGVWLADCMQQYCQQMEQAIEQWQVSPQLFQLKKMADPNIAPSNNDALEHMALSDYLDEKNAKSVLPAYAIQTTPKTWLRANINFMMNQQQVTDGDKLYFQMGLLKRWQMIDDPAFKIAVRECIKEAWNERRGDGFWANPIGKKVIAVRKHYDASYSFSDK